MNHAKIKTLKKLRNEGVKFDMDGPFIVFKNGGSAHYINMEIFGENVLVTEETTIHPNILKILPFIEEGK